jgi:serine/threonine protein phosphatase PrpC
MELKISVLSKPGGREINQDAYGVWSDANACFCVVSDGAGGHLGGEFASRLAVKHILDWFYWHPDPGAEMIAQALDRANDVIVDAQGRAHEVADMRATVLVLAVDTANGTARWGHIGDTRLYCFRRQHIIAQTRDHSVVQSMVDAGYLAAQDLRVSPGRNALLAALGDKNQFHPTIEEAEFRVEDGDVFLLCTDGLWEYIDEARMEQLLAQAGEPEAWLREMENEVLKQGRTDQDNYSALVIACIDPAQSVQQNAGQAESDETVPGEQPAGTEQEEAGIAAGQAVSPPPVQAS